MSEIDLRRYGANLSKDAEGIWLANAGAPVSYPEQGHANCLQVEDASFWFRHRNRCIAAVAQHHLDGTRGPIFDVGGGNGFVACGLLNAGFEVVLVEPGPQGARNARRRGLPHVICGTTDACGFAQGTLPAIGLFDVVEHIEDDLAFMCTMRRLLVPGGHVLLTVPAHAWLWSEEDIIAGHFRRHTRRSISTTLEQAGLEVTFASYFFRPLPLPILLQRALPHRLGWRRSAGVAAAAAADHATQGGTLVRWIDRALAHEVALLHRGESMRVGASLILVARCRA